MAKARALSDLTPNAHNPRTITDAKLKQLKAALLEFGDLSGIVYNRNTRQLVGGHQRRKILPPTAKLAITKSFDKPSRCGTVAVGYIDLDGERYAYREVHWDVHRERAANIAANKGAGEWDLPQLTEWMKSLSSFDVDFDISLTMFDPKELKAFAETTVTEHTRKAAKSDEPKEPRAKPGQMYALGQSRLKVGESNFDVEFCDAIIERFEKTTGETARLMRVKTGKPTTKLRKPVEQGRNRADA